MKTVTFNRFIHTTYITYSKDEYDRRNYIDTYFNIIISQRFDIYNYDEYNIVYNEINEFKKEMKVAKESEANTRYHLLK